MAFFASPAKPWLVKKLKERSIQEQESKPRLKGSSGVVVKEKHGQLMGLPANPARDVNEAVQEIRDEVEAARRRRSSVIVSANMNASVNANVDVKAIAAVKEGSTDLTQK